LISVAIPYVFPQVSAFDPMIQLRGIVLTLLFASVAGVITGGFMARLADGTEMASDTHYWEVADDFGKVNEMDALDVWLINEAIRQVKAGRGGEPGAVQQVPAVAVNRGPEEEKLNKEETKEVVEVGVVKKDDPISYASKLPQAEPPHSDPSGANPSMLPPSAQLPSPLPTTSPAPAEAPPAASVGNLQLPLSGVGLTTTPRSASGRGPKGVAFLRYTSYPTGEQHTQMVFTDKRERSGFIDISLSKAFTPRSARGGMPVLASGSTSTAPLALPAPVAPDGGRPSTSGGDGLSGTTGDQGQEVVRAEQRLPSQGPSAAMAVLKDSDVPVGDRLVDDVAGAGVLKA